MGRYHRISAVRDTRLLACERHGSASALSEHKPGSRGLLRDASQCHVSAGHQRATGSQVSAQVLPGSPVPPRVSGQIPRLHGVSALRANHYAVVSLDVLREIQWRTGPVTNSERSGNRNNYLAKSDGKPALLVAPGNEAEPKPLLL